VNLGPIHIEPDIYDAASKVFGQTVAGQLTTAVTDLEDALRNTGAMAGSDPGGSRWAVSYDQAVSVTVGAMTDLTNASYKLAAMLEQTGFNHGMAESASDPTRSVSTAADTTRYIAPTTLNCDPKPPSASGGSGSAPTGWGLIESAVGYVWPNGHQDKLRAAASAWSAAGQGLDFAAFDVDEAVQAVLSQQSPEVQDAATVCQGMQRHISDVADSCRGLSRACSDFAGYIDQAHHDVEHELISLAEWTAGIEAAGAFFGALTFGAAEVPAQGVEAGRIAATAARVGNIIAHLIDLAGAVAETISGIVTRVAEVCQRLKAILGARLTAATSRVVARLPGLGKDAERLAADGLRVSAEENAADDALYRAYAERQEARGLTPRSRQAWQNMVDSLRRNKAVGDGYRDTVADNLGIRYGDNGWQSEYTLKDLGRRYDIANPATKAGYEVKSGTTPTGEALTQLSKDEQAIRRGWTITWQLKVDLNPTVMNRLQELAVKYPGRFQYTVAGK
jgi:hypothetical protein